MHFSIINYVFIIKLFFGRVLCGVIFAICESEYNDMNEFVSVVVPIYNMGAVIEKCVNSLLNQDYSDFELILVNDGSTDNTKEICDRIKEQNSKVKVIHTENRGSGPARNAGIQVAKGKYVYFPDADDFIAPHGLSTMVKAMDNGRFDLVVFGFKNVNSKGRVVLEQKYADSEQKGNIIRNNYGEYIGYTAKWGIQGAPWNKFFDLEVIKNNKIEYPNLRRHQDEGFISRYMCFANNIHFIPDVIYTYFVNDLKREWQKYPVDYIDSVIGLYHVRKETVLTWNINDVITQETIKKEYICNVIKALELSFSPKMEFAKEERKKWIAEQVERSKINSFAVPNCLGIYQKIALKLIKNESYTFLYSYLRIKTLVEGTKLYTILRKK